MKLLTLNVYDEDFIKSVHSQTNNTGDDVLFVDWVPTDHKDFGIQIDMLSSLPNDVKLIVFDRNRYIDEDLINILVNRKSILLEPVVFPRKHFMFMPYWINFNTDMENQKVYNIGFIGNTIYPEAENRLLGLLKHFNIDIGVHTLEHLDDNKIKSFEGVFGVNSGDNVEWDKYSSTFIVDNEYNYEKGVMPDIRNNIKYRSLPILSHNHKWFHAMFGDFVAKDYKDLGWCASVTVNHEGFLDDLCEHIKKVFPDMIIDNFVEKTIHLSKTC